ncbi:MAG TPA: neutral/alkaline non-lysosomal ceramidase N-terminal domain-containing protein [Bryobacteraceae bacterium]|nr:neutral/alkaline non-lysosomal ceramidase N-terminal domain-containing protein [Bryobacteraceae bacterium]
MSASAQLEGQWKAGVAKVKITPDEPIWMAGYAARTKPSEGVQTDLYLKVLALDDGSGRSAVLVTTDLVGLRRQVADKIAERCAKQYGITRDRLAINSSHTHSGPTTGEFASRAGYDEQKQVVRRYTDQLIEKAVTTVGEALQNMRPARLEFAQGFAGFAVNRRRAYVGMRGLPAPVDHDVPVLAVRSVDDSPQAVIFGYACHNTTLGSYQINGDYAGYAQEALEKIYPGVTALFVLGCAGEANPLPRYQGTDPALTHYSLELVSMYGRILAASVDLTLHGKMRPVTGPLKTAFERVDIPFEKTPSQSELQARVKARDSNIRAQAERMLRAKERYGKLPERYPEPVQVWQFGHSLKFIALGGEAVVDYSLRLKAQHGWEDTWVAAYSNDVFGYVPSARVLKEGGYEAQGGDGGSFSAATEDIIVEKVRELVRRTAP